MIDHATVVKDDLRLDMEDLVALRLTGDRSSTVDPLRNLFDMDFTETLWEYEDSRVGDFIPGNLHQPQIDAHGEDSRHRFLFWGNQVGKTTLGAVECAMVALGRHPFIKPNGPALIWASALTWELWESILLPELLTWIPEDRIIKAPEPFMSTPGRRTVLVRADNGSVAMIVGKSAQQGRKSYQSAKVHFVWFDEEHPESIWNEVLLRLVRFGGRTLTTATPLMGLTWIYHRIYQGWERGEFDDVYCSHAGLMDNPAIEAEQIESIRNQFKGNPSELAARLHGKFARPSGLALDEYDPKRNLETFDLEMGLAKNKRSVTGAAWTHVCGIDFGYWRFAFLHGMVDHAGRCHLVNEYFSQKQNLETRAKHIHRVLEEWGAPPETKLWGDAANPTDINELNKEFKRLGSPYRCRAVRGESKARVAGTGLVNNLFQRGALMIRRGIGEDSIWYRGQNAASDGHPMGGSRLLYEIGQWRYETPKTDGKAQGQDPVDDTADGADFCAALRYMCMSHYRPPKKNKTPKKPANKNRDKGYENMQKAMREKLKRKQPPSTSEYGMAA